MACNVYLVLGTSNSGRKAIVKSLIEDTNGSATVLINKKEIGGNDSHYRRWALENGKVIVEGEALEGIIYFLTTIEEDLIDQIEAFKKWLDSDRERTLARVLAIVDCELAHRIGALEPWFEAIIYFADCVLLTKWETVPHKWLEEFQKVFKKKAYPCIFERIKKERVENPYLILDSEARRISHLFDGMDAIDSFEFDEEHLPEEPFELKVKEDPYLERTGNGARVISLPDPRDH